MKKIIGFALLICLTLSIHLQTTSIPVTAMPVTVVSTNTTSGYLRRKLVFMIMKEKYMIPFQWILKWINGI